MGHLLALLLLLISLLVLVESKERTSPPAGAVVVNPNATSGQFSNVADAMNALPNDASSQVVFIYPGTYQGQVNISRKGPVTVYGYTEDVHDFTQNTVTLVQAAALATGAGSDDLTGTLRIHSDNVSLYNIDVQNNFGVAKTNGQAIALSNYGSRFGAYASRFFSYQDTLLTNQGTQVYLKCYIEGAVDFIFGTKPQAYFEGNTIASKGAGCITASGLGGNDTTLTYVFNNNTLIAASDAFSNVTGKVFLGRPWGDWARVVFKNTIINTPLNKTIWSIWNSGDERIDHVFFAEFNSTGPGVVGAMRPNFSTVLSQEDAAVYTIASVVGADWQNWVDLDYLSLS